jgi:hypothetical protein
MNICSSVDFRAFPGACQTRSVASAIPGEVAEFTEGTKKNLKYRKDPKGANY